MKWLKFLLSIFVGNVVFMGRKRGKRNNLNGANLVISTSIEASKKLSYLNMVPVNLSSGEIPLYAEFRCPERDKLIEFLKQRAIIKKSLIIFPIL